LNNIKILSREIRYDKVEMHKVDGPAHKTRIKNKLCFHQEGELSI